MSKLLTIFLTATLLLSGCVWRKPVSPAPLPAPQPVVPTIGTEMIDWKTARDQKIIFKKPLGLMCDTFIQDIEYHDLLSAVSKNQIAIDCPINDRYHLILTLSANPDVETKDSLAIILINGSLSDELTGDTINLWNNEPYFTPSGQRVYQITLDKDVVLIITEVKDSMAGVRTITQVQVKDNVLKFLSREMIII